MEEKLWTHEDVAEYLSSTPATIRVRCSRREIPHLKVGRSVRFRKADIDRWLEKQRVEVAD